MAAARQMDNERNREELYIVSIMADSVNNIDANIPSYADGVLSCSVINSGTIAAQIVAIWVEDSNRNSAFVNVQSDPNSYISETQQSPSPRLGGTAINTATPPNANDPDLKYWIVTARGNMFSLKTTGPQGFDGADGNKWYNDESTEWSKINPPPIWNFGENEQVGDYYFNTKTRDIYVRETDHWRWIITLPKSGGQAGVAQGIGSIAMDFAGFKVYAFSSKPGVDSVLPAPSSFDVSKNSYLIFKVPVWNVDPDERDIVLSKDSRVWASITQQSTMKSGSFKLIDVNDATGKIVALSRDSVPLPYTDDTESTPPLVLYFGYDVKGTDITNDFPQTVPLNILLYGGIDGGLNNYGQNLPFVSIKMT